MTLNQIDSNNQYKKSFALLEIQNKEGCSLLELKMSKNQVKYLREGERNKVFEGDSVCTLNVHT